tara:strand:- start:937 stop:1089 length:153 start_codon:yes stop_codon:yes gene_type:complete
VFHNNHFKKINIKKKLLLNLKPDLTLFLFSNINISSDGCLQKNNVDKTPL